jgi:hypothetical protein
VQVPSAADVGLDTGVALEVEPPQAVVVAEAAVGGERSDSSGV